MLNLRHLDFTMLLAFDLLMRERSVSRAAEKMSQLLISSCDLNAQTMDRWLAKQGLERRVAVVVPNFLAAPFTVAATDLLLSLPRRIAEACIKSSPLKIVEVPFGLPAYDLIMAWHPLRDKDPAHLWLREQIIAVSREIDRNDGG